MSDEQLNNDELLSAYVDGELTGSELDQVEERLQKDPAARQLVEELRQLSSTLQNLPKEPVGMDLRQKILVCEEKALEHHAGSPRQWVWAAMALAATLMLMFFVSEDSQENGQLLADNSVVEKTPPLGDISISALPSTRSNASHAKKIDEINALQGVASDSSEAMPAKVIDSLAEYRLEEEAREEFTVQLKYRDASQFIQLLDKENLKIESNKGFFDARDETQQTEQLLVEATTEQLGTILATCYSDSFACQSVSISGNDPASKILNHLQQWQRFTKQDTDLVRSDQEFKQGKTNAQGRNPDNARDYYALGTATRSPANQSDSSDLTSKFKPPEQPIKLQKNAFNRSQSSTQNKVDVQDELSKRVRVLFILKKPETVSNPATNR